MPALDTMPPSDGRPELLVLRAIKLGDLLVAAPAFNALRRAFPDHRITLATTAWLTPVVDLLPVDVHLAQHGLDHAIGAEHGTIDVAVNMHGAGPESADLVTALGARREIRHRRPGEPDATGAGHPEWRNGVLERERWAGLVSAHGIPADPDDVRIAVPGVAPSVRDATIVHVGAFYGARHWPVDRFTAVARTLAERGEHVVVTGGADDVERARAVATGAGLPDEAVLAGTAPLDAFAAVVAAARSLVTVDTGAAHLASAYGIPSVVMFGPAPPEEWGPPATGPHAVLTDASVRVGEAFATEPDPALLAVQPEDVVRALDAVRADPTARVDLASVRRA